MTNFTPEIDQVAAHSDQVGSNGSGPGAADALDFEIDVSRTYRNKTGYEVGGYKLNNSFKTERLTGAAFIDQVIREGWPYTMAFQKRDPQETGAAARRVKTAKHIENFVSSQLLTGDDDSGAAGVVEFWLSDPFFSRYGWLFVESVNSQPGAEKGHPTLLFDRPITDPALYKECLQAFCSTYPRLDWLVNIDRTIYNREGATVHNLGNVCPFKVFEAQILTPYRQEEAAKQQAIEAARAERARVTTGKPAKGDHLAAFVAGYGRWIFDKVATRSKGDNRNIYIFWAGRQIAGVEASTWARPYLAELGDINDQIVEAARANGYLADYAHNDQAEVIRIFERGKAAGGGHIEQPEDNGAKFAEGDQVTVIIDSQARATGAVTAVKWLPKDSDPWRPNYQINGSLFPEKFLQLAAASDQANGAAETTTAASDPVDWLARAAALEKDDKQGGLQLVKEAGDQIDAASWPVLRDAINHVTGATKGDLNAAYKAATKEAEEKRKAVAEEARRAAREVRREQVGDTFPYTVSGGCLTFCGAFGDQVIADFTATITQEKTTEAGNKTFAIGGRGLRGGAFNFEIGAADFNDARVLTRALGAAAGGLDPVAAGMGKHLSPAISKLTPEAGLKQILQYERVGWASDGRFIIPGLLPKNTTVSLSAKLPYDVSGGDLARGLAALESLITAVKPEHSIIILSAIFQAALADLVGWQNERYAVMVTGRTGSLKTTFTQTALAIYGAGFTQDVNLIKLGEGATRNAVMAYATQARDMPILIDNYKPNTAGGGSGFVGLLHNILEGGNKDRLRRDSTLMDPQPVTCFPIFTGEDVPDTDAATLARLLVVPFARDTNSVNERLAAATDAAAHLPAVGRAWLTWLQSKPAALEAARQRFPDCREDWVTRLSKQNSAAQNVLRVATNLATNELSWWVVSKHPELGGLAAGYMGVHLNGLREIAGDMLLSTESGLEATRFISHLRELLAGGRVALLPVKGNAETVDNRAVIGWKEHPDGAVYLLPALARSEVKRWAGDDLNNVSDSMLYRQLKEAGYLASVGNKRATIQKRLGSDIRQVLHIKADVMNLKEEGKHLL